MNKSIISIGGVGGSGTRLIAQILESSGYFMGNDLNESSDTLLYTLIFKRQNILTLDENEFNYAVNLFIKIMSSDETLSEKELSFLMELALKDRTLHSKEWLLKRVEGINSRITQNIWGWKEPNTHIIIEKLLEKIPKLKFIYVYRNGLDMAYSENQNQLRLWGSIFFNDYNIEINPANSLRYWCITHKRMMKLKEKYSTRVLMLNFDDLCLKPDIILGNLSKFIEYEEDILEFKKMIKVPSSIGRHKEYSSDSFNKEDLDFVCLKI